MRTYPVLGMVSQWSRCVPDRHFDRIELLGTFCFEPEGLGCGDRDARRRPYSSAEDLTSLGGVADTYCLPPSTATCASLADARARRDCDTNLSCGVAGLEDAYCVGAGTQATYCSYLCMSNSDCPGDHLTECGLYFREPSSSPAQ